MKYPSRRVSRPESIEARIKNTARPEDWSAAVLDPAGNVKLDVRGEEPHDAASHGKLLIGLAAKHSGVPFDMPLQIKKDDRRTGGGILKFFPAGHPTTLGRMVEKMYSGDNTAAIIVARAIRETSSKKEQNTAGLINEIVESHYNISPDTGLVAADDPTKFYYGEITAIDSATLFQAAMQDENLARGAKHGGMYYGMRRKIDRINGPTPEVVQAEKKARNSQFIRGLRSTSFYKDLMLVDWPETQYPNKEASDNDPTGNVRHEVMATPGGVVGAVMHSSNSLNGRIQPAFGPENPDYQVFATIGVDLANLDHLAV